MSAFLQKYSSSIHTFIASFIVTILGAVTLIPADKILDPQTWTTAFIVGVVTSALRAGIKAISPIA